MVVDQLPRLGKRDLICLLLFTCNHVVSVWRGFLFLWVLWMGYVILLWHSLSLPYNYFSSETLFFCAQCFTDLFSVLRSLLVYHFFYTMAYRSLYRHASKWIPTSLALQDTGPLHTTWRYNDLIVVVYLPELGAHCVAFLARIRSMYAWLLSSDIHVPFKTMYLPEKHEGKSKRFEPNHVKNQHSC